MGLGLGFDAVVLAALGVHHHAQPRLLAWSGFGSRFGSANPNPNPPAPNPNPPPPHPSSTSPRTFRRGATDPHPRRAAAARRTCRGKVTHVRWSVACHAPARQQASGEPGGPRPSQLLSDMPCARVAASGAVPLARKVAAFEGVAVRVGRLAAWTLACTQQRDRLCTHLLLRTLLCALLWLDGHADLEARTLLARALVLVRRRHVLLLLVTLRTEGG